MRFGFKFAVALALATAFVGCGRTYNTAGLGIRELEELAEKAFAENDFHGASRLYTQLMFEYPGSSRMDFYLYRLGLSKAGEGLRGDAVFYLDRVLNEYPRSQWADDCAFHAARIWWEQRNDYRKDLTPVLNCRDRLKAFYEDYPASPLADRADSLMAAVNDLLARRALFIGRFYARRKKYDAALLYLREALNDYGKTSCTGDVLVCMGDVYFAKGNKYTAGEYYRRALDEGGLDLERTGDVLEKLGRL